MKRDSMREPDFETACGWWSDLPNIWTPIGWKNHMLRFNVFWNGSILAEPSLNRNTGKYAGQGVQVTVGSPFCAHDDGMFRQGWEDTAAPVLWTELPFHEGLLLRWSVFAHIPGGEDVKTGVDPLFAWVRFSIHETCRGLPLEQKFPWTLVIQGPHVGAGMSIRRNIHLDPAKARYPRPLRAAAAEAAGRTGFRVLEEDGRVRLGLAPGAPYPVALHCPEEKNPNYRLCVETPVKKGARFDLLIPILPANRETFDAELALGYDQALREANRYWSKIPKTAARFQVPEKPINDAIRNSVKFFEVLTERNAATGKYCMVNGSFVYAALWATPGAMGAIMLMDILGYHDVVGRHLAIFRDEQGTVVPPGDAYAKHPGYLSTPALYKSIDWLSDNGAILYMLAMHGLYSGDRAYIERFTDAIVKACDWICAARRMTNHAGVKGVLPPAVATDKGTRIQAAWNDGWNYKGLTSAVRLLKQIGHPRAAEFAAEAADYRAAYLKAYRAKSKTMPRWTDARGARRPLPPTALFGEARDESRHAFYLDTGPLFLVFAGLLDADDELMETIRLWFREGPPAQFYRHDAECWQIPALSREMSSCEPCYSWNVFHAHRLGEREKFLEGMYSLFAGSLSRQTGISCETRGGITGNIFSAPLAVYLARLAVIDDEIKENELHLLRLMPAAWLKPGAQCVFEKMPTFYGPVTLQTKLARDGKTLDVVFRPNYRVPPEKVILHVPPAPKLQRVCVNGRVCKGRVVTLADCRTLAPPSPPSSC